jgi:polyisoprenoid-binding protein YceI
MHLVAYAIASCYSCTVNDERDGTTEATPARSDRSDAMKTTWTIDPAHTQAEFSAKHMMITNVRGHFDGATGTIEFDEADPTNSSVEATFDASTIDSGQAQRDGHLKGPDFLDVAKWPKITFRSTGIEKAGSGYRITGDLTIRDVTKPVVLDADFIGIVKGMQGGRHAGFSARTKIDREAWGLTWNMGLEAGGWLVGKEVSISIDAAADQVAVQQLEADAA